jgi:hypothetical protein
MRAKLVVLDMSNAAPPAKKAHLRGAPFRANGVQARLKVERPVRDDVDLVDVVRGDVT